MQHSPNAPAPDGEDDILSSLSALPGTALWALYHRSSLLYDPMAERTVEQIKRLGIPLDSVLGRRRSFMSHQFAARAKQFDREIRAFLDRHPDATVVSLGEGLETQFWRVDNGHAHWITVDLPEMAALRRRLLPSGERQRTVRASALDTGEWMGHVPEGRPVLIVAQGLLIYLRPSRVVDLVRSCADRFPGGTVIFDTCPRWFTALSRTGVLHCGPFRVPPMYFTMSPASTRPLQAARPRLDEIRCVPQHEASGPLKYALRHGHRIPLARRTMPGIFRAHFA